MSAGVRRLLEFPSDELAPHIAESEREGWGFLIRLRAEWDCGVNRFDRNGEALLSAWVDGVLAGVCGLNIDPFTLTEGTGRVRHLYVRLAHRRLGIGRMLVAEVIGMARGRFHRLRLRTGNPSAARL